MSGDQRRALASASPPQALLERAGKRRLTKADSEEERRAAAALATKKAAAERAERAKAIPLAVVVLIGVQGMGDVGRRADGKAPDMVVKMQVWVSP